MLEPRKIAIIKKKAKEVSLMEKLRMNVQGRVQGVGFRYMTK
ncbi:acylphosphatase, partial [Streptococcus anginosus]|nr:acylphosphatase [Streptococcus anginosus]